MNARHIHAVLVVFATLCSLARDARPAADPRVHVGLDEAGHPALAWKGETNQQFLLEARDGASDSVWQVISTNEFSLSAASNIYRATGLPENAAQQFFRLRVETLCDAPLCFAGRTNLLAMLGRPIQQNVLKLFSAAADPVSNRVYVSGIMTRHMGILDGSTEEWIGSLDTGDYGWKYLYLDPVARFLYIANASDSTLQRIHLDTGASLGPVAADAVLFKAAVDTRRARLLLGSDVSPYFRAVDGATLLPIFGTDALGSSVGSPIYDEDRDVVYLFDVAATGASREIHVVSPTNGARLGTIPYTMPPNQRERSQQFDKLSNRFFIATTRTLRVLDGSGVTRISISFASNRQCQDLIYDAAHDRIAALTLEATSGAVEAVAGHLEVYHPSTGALERDIQFGRKPHRMTLNTANQNIYVPNGDASVVWSLPTGSYTHASPIRLGESLEQIVTARGGGLLYMNSRLGGSYLAQFDTDSAVCETFTNGVWPIPIRADPNGARLVVANAWDSTLDLYNLNPTRALTATIPIGLPPGSTDRLPDLAVDFSNDLAYAAYPEFGKIAVVNLATTSAVALLTVTNFPAKAEGGGPGELQVAVNPATQRLYLFLANQRRLRILDASANYAQLADVDLSSLAWNAVMTGANHDLMFLDHDRGRLFVGPYECDPTTGLPTGRALADGHRIFAFDPAENAYWASGVHLADGLQQDFVAVLDRDSLALRHLADLGEAHKMLREYTLDSALRRLYIARPHLAEFDTYAVGVIPP